MNTKRPNLLLLCFFLSFNLSFAQQATDFTCGFDELRTPAEQQVVQSFEQQLRQYLLNKQGTGAFQKGSIAPPYVVPVVIHIIHNGGPENIPDARVLAAVDHLNQAFAAQDYYGQQGATVNTQIQFCMAKRDPDGNATNGITRTVSSLTNMEMETQDLQLKDLIRWKPLDYINIWVVNEIVSLSSGSGVAGYAYFPGTHGLPMDGIVCEAKYFGTSPAEDGLFIHEMGHYLGLYHTFEGGCPNNDCTLDGDRICDTPPDNAIHTACPFNSCTTDVAPGSPFLTDVDDFTGDFMDYSPFSCYHFFTGDQATRMQASVEMARMSLLESKACQSPCSLPIQAAFSAAPNPVLAGETLVLTNNSNNATQFSWTANGIEFAQTQDATVVFNSVGERIIVLTATNSDPNCEAVSFTLVEVQCPIHAAFSPSLLEAPEASTLTFTNTSTGTGTINYEWSINGQTVSSATDLSYTFPNSGFYTVSLKASGAFCTQETSIQIKIANACGLLPEPVVVAFTSQRKLFQPRDMEALPDGSMIQCGEHFQQPMVTKWDEHGNLLWQREAPINGSFTEIESSPDGSFLLIGEDLLFYLFIVKMDANGNFLWIKTIQNTSIQYFSPRHFDFLAVNPDGTFGLLFRDEFEDGGYLSKLSADGDILWTRKIPLLGPTGSLQIAADGSGDFVFLARRPSALAGIPGFSVLFFSQNGDFKTMHNHVLSIASPIYNKNLELRTYADGGYSVFYVVGNSAFTTITRKYMIRCNADGSLRWARQYLLPNGHQYSGSYIRPIPGEKGWLIIDSRRDAAGIATGDFLERLDSNGQLLWTRYLGDTPANDIWVMPPVLQSGRIRGTHCDFFNQDMNLLSFEDTNEPAPCVPLVNDAENFNPIMVATAITDTIPIPQDIFMVDLPLVFSEVEMTRTDVCTIILPCPEICANQLDDDDDGYVDCYDSDCDCFETDTSCLVDIPIHHFSAKLGWQSSVDAASVAGVPLVANLNPGQDSLPEIIIVEASAPPSPFLAKNVLIFKGDGSNASNPSVLNLPMPAGEIMLPHPSVADLDGNGIPELIVVTSDQKIRVYTGFDPNASPCMTEWVVSAQTTWSGNSRPYVADFDGDGIGEIFSGNDVFKLDLSNPPAPVLNKVLDGNGAAGQLGWILSSSHATSSTAADLLSRSDCNGDPDCDGLEIAAGYQIYSIDIDSTDGDGFQIKVQRDLNMLDPNQVHEDGYTAIADLNLDGTPEVIVSGVFGLAFNGFYVWNKNGFVQAFQHSSFGPMVGMVCVAEVFDDKTAGFAQNFPELLVCQQNSLVCLNLQKAQATPNTPYWWTSPTTDLSGLTDATVFDFNGDGLSEIVYRDQDNLRVLYGGAAPFPAGVDSERNWFKTIAGSGTGDEYPIIADVDRDGAAEIVVTSFLTPFVIDPSAPTDTRGRLRVFESDQFPWLPARAVWNQFNYFGVNINDDLSVPKTQQKHWLEMGGIGSGKRPFNAHLAQTPSLNPFITNQLKVADALIVFDSTVCRTDSLELYLTLCNQGSAVLPSGAPLAFYLGDPTSTAAPLLFTVPLNNVGLAPGDCSNIPLKIPATYNADIFAVINDNGTLPRPFNLSANFPSTAQLECHYGNNMISFSVQHQTPLLDLGPDLSLCKSSVIELSANPNFQQYHWQDGSTAPNFTAFGAGKYWVDALDACGFRQTDTVNIVLNTLASLDLPDQLVRCEGESIDLTASGFFQYTWAPVDSVNCSNCATVHVEANRSFTLQLTAASGDCFVSDSVQIQIHPNPKVQLLALNGACSTDASITPIVTGEGPFNFSWSDMSTDSILNTTQSGTYILEIIDQNACHALDSATVTDFTGLEISANSSNSSCANTSNAAIDLNILSGTPPLQFLWSTGATTEDLGNLPSGIYTVLTTDSNGCTATLSKTLSDPPVLFLSLQKTDLNCPGDFGSIDLSAGGGTPPLSYLWSTGATTEDLDMASWGTYTVSITDSLGCNLLDSATLLTLGSIPILQVSTDTLTCEKTTGMLSVSSNVANSSFLWSGPGGFSATDASPMIGTGGNYAVTVTEPLGGCTTVASLVALLDTISPAILLAAHLVEVLCDQDSVAISAAGSSNGPDFDIQWTAGSGGAILSSANALTITVGSAGLYDLLITDLSNECTARDTVEVLELGNPSGLISVDSVHCFGEKNGVIRVLNSSGGTPPLRYSIDQQDYTSDPVFENLAAGVYTLEILDAKGCTFSTSIEVAQPAPFSVDLTGDTLVAPGATAHLQATVQPLDFVPVQINWTANDVAQVMDQLQQSVPLQQSTLFQIRISDANGCIASDTWLVRVDDIHKIYAPNVLYPGNPGGHNQIFLIFAGKEVQEIESLTVFDRWGEEVYSNQHFQANDETQGWDGDFRGKPVPAGVYVWTVKVRFKDGSLKAMSGDLTLYRG